MYHIVSYSTQCELVVGARNVDERVWRDKETSEERVVITTVKHPIIPAGRE